jgi:hypothetical protein
MTTSVRPKPDLFSALKCNFCNTHDGSEQKISFNDLINDKSFAPLKNEIISLSTKQQILENWSFLCEIHATKDLVSSQAQIRLKEIVAKYIQGSEYELNISYQEKNALNTKLKSTTPLELADFTDIIKTTFYDSIINNISNSNNIPRLQAAQIQSVTNQYLKNNMINSSLRSRLFSKPIEHEGSLKIIQNALLKMQDELNKLLTSTKVTANSLSGSLKEIVAKCDTVLKTTSATIEKNAKAKKQPNNLSAQISIIQDNLEPVIVTNKPINKIFKRS